MFESTVIKTGIKFRVKSDTPGRKESGKGTWWNNITAERMSLLTWMKSTRAEMMMTTLNHTTAKKKQDAYQHVR